MPRVAPPRRAGSRARKTGSRSRWPPRTLGSRSEWSGNRRCTRSTPGPVSTPTSLGPPTSPPRPGSSPPPYLPAPVTLLPSTPPAPVPPSPPHHLPTLTSPSPSSPPHLLVPVLPRRDPPLIPRSSRPPGPESPLSLDSLTLPPRVPVCLPAPIPVSLRPPIFPVSPGSYVSSATLASTPSFSTPPQPLPDPAPDAPFPSYSQIILLLPPSLVSPLFPVPPLGLAAGGEGTGLRGTRTKKV